MEKKIDQKPYQPTDEALREFPAVMNRLFKVIIDYFGIQNPDLPRRGERYEVVNPKITKLVRQIEESIEKMQK